MTQRYNEKCEEVFLLRKELATLRADLMLIEAKEKSSQIKSKQEAYDEKQNESLKKELNVLIRLTN